MARYIDADKLREYWLENGVNENIYNTNNVLGSIDYQPTADVVEVVRCKDCKHWRIEHGGFCEASNALSEVNNENNDFCSYGERK